MSEVWVLGATGRSGRMIATELSQRGVVPTLVGRDASRLAPVAGPLDAPVLVFPSTEEVAAGVRARRPAVVVNTVGPFVASGGLLARACVEVGASYVDLANDVAAVLALLSQDAAARHAGSTLVTGAGFGVTAIESVVVKLCEDRPKPVDVRVDMIPSLDSDGGPVGEALAGTILQGLPGVKGGRRYGGRRYAGGQLAPAPIGGEVQTLTLPDGSVVKTGLMPFGELVAAQRASGALNVVSASSEAPTARAIRLAFPVLSSLLLVPRLRSFAIRRLAAVKLPAKPRPRPDSWGHARLEWADGTVRSGWLKVGDAQVFTGAVPAEVVFRLLAGQGRPGAFTPAALFSSSLAEACGGKYLID